MGWTAAASTSALHSAWKWLGRLAFWALLLLEVLAMGAAGLSKFTSMDGWMYWFARFGYPPRMSLVIGSIELVGAGLLLLPRLASYTAIVLCGIMVGALHAVLTTETDLSWFDPLLHIAFLGVIGAVRWRNRWWWSKGGAGDGNVSSIG